MFLTVQEVQKDSNGIYVPRTTSIIAENVVNYREWRKGPEYGNIEGPMTKVNMRRPDGFDYFHVIAEHPEHFAQRVNKVLWLNQNTNAHCVEISSSASSSPESSESSSENNAQSEVSGSLTSQ